MKYTKKGKKIHISRELKNSITFNKLNFNYGKDKELLKNNTLLISGDHNPDGARVVNEYLQTLDCDKHIILGMMSNKDHNQYIGNFKNISSLTTIDIPNQPNSIGGKDLKNKLNYFENVQYKENIFVAIKSISVKKNDVILITGSLYLMGEVLKLFSVKELDF